MKEGGWDACPWTRGRDVTIPPNTPWRPRRGQKKAVERMRTVILDEPVHMRTQSSSSNSGRVCRAHSAADTHPSVWRNRHIRSQPEPRSQIYHPTFPHYSRPCQHTSQIWKAPRGLGLTSCARCLQSEEARRRRPRPTLVQYRRACSLWRGHRRGLVWGFIRPRRCGVDFPRRRSRSGGTRVRPERGTHVAAVVCGKQGRRVIWLCRGVSRGRRCGSS